MAHETNRPHIDGVDVREEDLEPMRGLRTMSWVFRGSAALIVVLAIGQVVSWFMDPPPGGVGSGVLIGDTIRLIVFAALLWAAGNLASIVIKLHYDVRAGRILLARQTYMMKQKGIAQGYLPAHDVPAEERRATDA